MYETSINIPWKKLSFESLDLHSVSRAQAGHSWPFGGGMPLRAMLAPQNILLWHAFLFEEYQRKEGRAHCFKCAWNKLHCESKLKPALNTFPMLLVEFYFGWRVSTIVRDTWDSRLMWLELLLNLSIKNYLHVERGTVTTCFTEITCRKGDVKLHRPTAFNNRKTLGGGGL